MVRLKGECLHHKREGMTRSTLVSCWHQESRVLRVFVNGRLLLENPEGYVRAAAPSEVAQE